MLILGALLRVGYYGGSCDPVFPGEPVQHLLLGGLYYFHALFPIVGQNFRQGIT